MNPMRRVIVFVFSILILAQAIVLWGATGSKNTTALPGADAMPWVSDSAAIRAASTSGESSTKSENTPRFAFGLMPNNNFKSPQAISLLTLGAPALLLALMAMSPGNEGKKG